MGPEEEDGVFVGRWLDSSLRKLINLKQREKVNIYQSDNQPRSQKPVQHVGGGRMKKTNKLYL